MAMAANGLRKSTRASEPTGQGTVHRAHQTHPGTVSALQRIADASDRVQKTARMQALADARGRGQVAQRAAPVIQMVEVKNNNKYARLLQDVSATDLYFGISWKPSNVMVRGVDFSGGEYASILVHLMNNGRNSKWVSTAAALDIPQQYAGDTGFIYHCRGITNRGLDANAAYAAHWNNKDEQADLKAVGKTAKSARYAFKDQNETSIWNAIKADEIVGAYTLVEGDWAYYTRQQLLENTDQLPQTVQDRL